MSLVGSVIMQWVKDEIITKTHNTTQALPYKLTKSKLVASSISVQFTNSLNNTISDTWNHHEQRWPGPIIKWIGTPHSSNYTTATCNCNSSIVVCFCSPSSLLAQRSYQHHLLSLIDVGCLGTNAVSRLWCLSTK